METHPIQRDEFRYQVFTAFRMTGRVWKRLVAVASKHYDGKCKEAARHGGFIYGWGNQILFECDTTHSKRQEDIQDDWSDQIVASISQLDTCAKICEQERLYFRDDSYDLLSTFARLMRDANEESRRINKEQAR